MPAKNEKKAASGKKAKQVEGELRFFVANGETLSSIEEFGRRISGFDAATINHHITDDRNDFADWIENVFSDKTLAAKVRKARVPSEIEKLFN